MHSEQLQTGKNASLCWSQVSGRQHRVIVHRDCLSFIGYKLKQFIIWGWIISDLQIKFREFVGGPVRFCSHQGRFHRSSRSIRKIRKNMDFTRERRDGERQTWNHESASFNFSQFKHHQSKNRLMSTSFTEFKTRCFRCWWRCLSDLS